MARPAHRPKHRLPSIKWIPGNIVAPMVDNETWAECERCHRTYKIEAVPGLLHLYVERCPECIKKRYTKEKI